MLVNNVSVYYASISGDALCLRRVRVTLSLTFDGIGIPEVSNASTHRNSLTRASHTRSPARAHTLHRGIFTPHRGTIARFVKRCRGSRRHDRRRRFSRRRDAYPSGWTRRAPTSPPPTNGGYVNNKVFYTGGDTHRGHVGCTVDFVPSTSTTTPLRVLIDVEKFEKKYSEVGDRVVIV